MKRLAAIAALCSLLLATSCGGKSDIESTSPGYNPGYGSTYPPQPGQQINSAPAQSGNYAPKNISKEAAAQANLAAEVDGLKSQIQSLKAEVEDLGFKLRGIEEKTGAEGNSLPELSKRVNRLDGNVNRMASQLAINLDNPDAAQASQGGEQAQTSQAQAPAAQASQAQAQAQQATGDPAEALYNKAYQAFQQKQYDQAIGIWGEFAKSYPKHNLLPNAYFWQGEAFFQKNDFPRAVLAYQEVIDKFPKSPKLPAAMLKQGYAFKKLNKDNAAKLIFQDLVKKFPDTVEARRAKEILAGKN